MCYIQGKILGSFLSSTVKRFLQGMTPCAVSGSTLSHLAFCVRFLQPAWVFCGRRSLNLSHVLFLILRCVVAGFCALMELLLFVVCFEVSQICSFCPCLIHVLCFVWCYSFFVLVVKVKCKEPCMTQKILISIPPYTTKNMNSAMFILGCCQL